MSFQMQPSRLPHGGWPEGMERTPGSDQTYPAGCPVTWTTGSQELDIHPGTSTVTNILGVTLEGVVSGDADNPNGKVSVVSAAHPNIFIAKLVNGSGTVQTAATSNIHVLYGMIVVGSGSTQWWGVDEDDTGDPVLEVIGIDTDRNVVIFRFLNTAVQTSGAF